MDLQTRMAQYKVEHLRQKRGLLHRLEQKSHQINHITQNHVQKHPQGSALFTRKKQLENRLVEEKRRLYEEFSAQEQKLNEQFATDRKTIDNQILEIGRCIAGTDEELKAIVAEHAAIQREVTNLNTRGLVGYP